MKSNAPVVLLLFTSLGLGAWGVWEHLQRSRMEADLGNARSELVTLRRTAEEKVALKAKTALERTGPKGLDLPKTEEPGAGVATAPETPKVPDISAMMKDPAMRDAMKSQMRMGMEMMYRDLFDLLGLPRDQEDKLMDLLAEKASAGMDAGMALMSGDKAVDPKEAGEKMAALEKESEAKLRDLLGDEKYDQLDRYEKSQAERMQLKTLTSELRAKGLDLSEAAESQLMDAMFEERTNFKFDTDFTNQKPENLLNLNPEAMAQFSKQNQELQAKVAGRAEQILTAEQMEVFRKSQEQQAAVTEMGLKMASQMFGGKDNGATPPAPTTSPLTQ